MQQATEEVLRYFRLAGTTQQISKDEIIYMQGESAPNIYLIARGRVRMYYIGAEGKEITYQIIGEGQLIGVSAFLRYAAQPTTIRAVNDVTLISCTVDDLRPFMRKSQELTDAILTLLTDNYHFLCAQVKRLAVYDRFQKVASYLLDQTEENSGAVGIVNSTLPYTHEELGVCLNLSRVTVTSILNQFQRQGLVRLGRKHIQVIDRQGLKSLIP